ncbi:MAG TPA: hypothetical protein VFB90_02185 [Dehalococcoidia bacterium]|nr:hypothetical protein [Dehalococcoidia bacterium]
MLGQQIGEENGRVTGRRILPGDDYRYVKMEISFETNVTLFGAPGMNAGTYTVYERVPGQIYGEGQGIVMLQSGESAIWNAHGVGRPTGEGAGMKIAGSVAFQAGQGKLARLNEVLVAVEHEAADDGSVHSKLWEWTCQ